MNLHYLVEVHSIYSIRQSCSGKSTLVNLLLKLYAPSSGSVRIDGHDLKRVQAATLRKQIGVVQPLE
jgi:subfamily B ATP-binding cassette protein HlyB/CyaB